MKIAPERTIIPVHLILTAGLHGIAFLTGLRGMESLPVPPEWTRDFCVLTALTFACSAALVFNRKKSVMLFLFTIRFLSFFIIGIPFGDRVTTEFFLLTSVILEIFFCLPFLPAACVSVPVLLMTLFLQQDFSVYFLTSASPGITSTLALAAWGVMMILLGGFLNSLYHSYLNSRRETEYQQSVINELIGANRGYLEYATNVEVESTEKERKRIITELHDIIGQSFTNILAITDASAKHPPSEEELEDVFSVVRSLARSGLQETRSVLYRLHTLKTVKQRGLKELYNLISIFEQSTKVKVTADWSNYPWNPGSVLNNVVYKVLREALINSFRHGKATSVSVHFWKVGNRVNVDIQDNGSGAAVIKEGIGLSSMQEQVRLAEGTIRFASSARGFGIHFELPCSAGPC